MVVATRKLKQNRKLPLRDLPPVVRGAGVVLEGACPLVVPIGRLGRRGTGLVEVLNGVLAAVEHEFGPPSVQCKSQAPPHLLEEDGLARPVVDVEKLEILISELRGDQVGGDVECVGQLRVRAGDEAQNFSPSSRC